MSLLRFVPGVRYEDDIEVIGDSFGSDVPHVGGQRQVNPTFGIANRSRQPRVMLLSLRFTF